jgi:hypothetical protein
MVSAGVYMQTDRQTYRQTIRQTDRQTDRQTYRQTDSKKTSHAEKTAVCETGAPNF